MSSSLLNLDDGLTPTPSAREDIKPSSSALPSMTVTPVLEPTVSDTIQVAPEVDTDAELGDLDSQPFKPDLGFWIIFISLALCVWLAAIDLSSLATALPTIVADLPGSSSFVWVSSAYTLASTAILPLSGNLATVFGRQATLEGFIVVFAVGSAVTGAAKDMTTAIAGRTVQGLGGGGLLACANIVVADLVPLRQRGTYEAAMAVVWAVTSAVGPPIGGALAQAGQWRWLFWMNLPLCAGAGAMVAWFLRLKKPEGSWRSKLRRVDWVGNVLVIGAAASSMLALTQGGIAHPWSSLQILLPLILGLLGLCLFLAYELLISHFPRISRSIEPMVPLSLLATRTALSGYLGSFAHGLSSILLIYYLPVYFQACMLSTPLRSSIQLFPTAFTIAPFSIAAGASVALTNHYLAQNVIPWIVCIAGFALLSTLSTTSSTAAWVGYQVLTSAGLGVLWVSIQFPVLAPLPASKNAPALAFLAFVHSAANTFGVTIGAAILQNELRRLLPVSFASLFPEGTDIAYTAIPQIPLLPSPLQGEVREAFAGALSTMWKVSAGLCALGLVSTAPMRQLRMEGEVAREWGREEEGKRETVALAPMGRAGDGEGVTVG